MTVLETSPAIDLPDDWRAAIARIFGERRRRVMVIGGVDVGKSSFATALLHAWTAGEEPMLLDADPGQKMVGPPGTVTLGAPGDAGLRLKAMRFVGTTSAAAVAALAGAAGRLSRAAGDRPFVVNSSGLVRGLGVTLKLAKIRAVAPDLLVAVGAPSDVAPIVATSGVPAVTIGVASSARRKSASRRAAARRATFAAHLASAEPMVVPASALRTPVAACLTNPSARPVCVVADASGHDLSLGVLEGAEDGVLHLITPPPASPIAEVRVGAMWARHTAAGWQLLDELLPAHLIASRRR